MSICQFILSLCLFMLSCRFRKFKLLAKNTVNLILNKMPAVRKTTPEQIEKLLDFVEKNMQLTVGQSASSPTITIGSISWIEIAKELNTLNPLFMKSPKGWKGYWHELLYKTKKKLLSTSSLRTFNMHEERLLRMMGFDNVPKSQSSNTQMSRLKVKKMVRSSRPHHENQKKFVEALLSLARSQAEMAASQKMISESLQGIRQDFIEYLQAKHQTSTVHGQPEYRRSLLDG